ncbi:MFS transporter [Fodinisporobacter ferrooxydans]|uniref:MFS transporter n=1 Tax=Fodinisporobacter ferrooxydans TaxID=2901836 RepID=A0ABY4CFI0_9BACL|nr:MFS transporter [Alicyclobacillaceae bacterium MYW30-H2]
MEMSKKYDIKLVWFIFFILGFVMLDRLAITFLFPIIAPILHLNNTEIGQIMMWMTLAFDVSAVLISSLSDKSGYRKRWLIPFVFATAIFSGMSAFAVSFGSMLVLRVLNGFGEGPTYPLSASMIMAESSPERVGRNIGFAQSGVGLIGLALAPLVVTQLAVHTNWRVAFLLTCVPTLIMGLILIKYTREIHFQKSDSNGTNFSTFIEALKYRNVLVSVFVSVCLMIALWVMNIFAPLFLTKVDHLTEAQMGYVMGIMGLGAFAWGFLVPLISDYWGRKPTLVLFSFLSVFPPIIMYFYHGGWVNLAIIAFFLNVVQGVFPLFMNIIPMETVPERLAATASALSMGVGEVIGAAVTPAVAGVLADHFGLPIVMFVAAAGPLLATIVGFALIETRQRTSKENLLSNQNSDIVF